MILVTLGTQDKGFTRLLKQIDKEIDKGVINEKVIVQAGCTKYQSNNMEIFDLVSSDELDKFIDEARIIITHGGAGSILSAIKKGKVVIAAARLKKYKEHHNDHQRQIVSEFAREGYILELRDFEKLGKVLSRAEAFKPKKFKSNTNNMVRLIDDYIEGDNHISWYNKYKEGLLYLFFGGCTTLVNIISFAILRKVSIEVYISNIIAWILSVIFAFITNKLIVFESKGKSFSESIKECCSFFFFRIISLLVDMGIMYVLIDLCSVNELGSKILSNIVVIIVNYVFSKLFVFKKRRYN